MTRVKICGITGVRMASVAAGAGADLIGVVFAASPRQVTAAKAREIAAAAREAGVPVVGVFVNMPAAEVNSISSSCGLDRVQLSGDEPFEYCREIERPVIKAVHVHPDWDEERLLACLRQGRALSGARPIVYLLDNFSRGRYGGTGRAFSWEIARRAAGEFEVIIAGGLSPENVGEVVGGLHPWGVDVSSGVETGGAKDESKIKAFIKAARAADRIARGGS